MFNSKITKLNAEIFSLSIQICKILPTSTANLCQFENETRRTLILTKHKLFLLIIEWI